MKSIEKQSTSANHSAISVGNLAELNNYTLKLAPGIEIPGKVFLGSALNTTGAEISFQTFDPGCGVSFLHTHKTHEELYIFVKGSGEFQVDGNIFSIAEGSVVRVAPKGKRSLRNTANEPLIMICIQYKADTFDASDAQDGDILNQEVSW